MPTTTPQLGRVTLDDTVVRLSREVERLERSGSTLSDWRRLGSELFVAIMRAQRELIRVQREMIEGVRAVALEGAWRQPHRDVHAVHCVLGALRGLRATVESRILEHEVALR